MARAEQLCQKTNQFNLRTERYTAESLQLISKDPSYESFLFQLTDRFGDHGIVGLVIAKLKGKTAFLNTFLVSCRILGRHLESWAMNELCNRLKNYGCKWILAEFRLTQRNTVAESFLAELGLIPLQWESISENHPMFSLRDMVDEQGQQYFSELNMLKIPNLEVFQHEDI